MLLDNLIKKKGEGANMQRRNVKGKVTTEIKES